MKVSNQEMHPLHDVAPDDAIGMLIADHKQVAKLFAKFQRLHEEGDDQGKEPLVKAICQALILHTQLEEEIFYPAVRDAIEGQDQVDEAVVEHAGAKLLIEQLRGAEPDDPLYDARVTVLGEQIYHHVEEEEGSLFPQARHAGLDTLALGAVMQRRREELGGPPPEIPPSVRVMKSSAAKSRISVRDRQTSPAKPAAKTKSATRPKSRVKTSEKARKKKR